MAKFEVRPLGLQDRDEWEPLWQGYLIFYNTSLSSAVTDTTWARLNDPAEPMHGLGAYMDRRLIRIVHYLYHRSTWTIGPYCYLQDCSPQKKQEDRE